jgi:hypothetical protein
MLLHKAIPLFGQKLRPSSYYETITATVSTLRPYSSLKTVADQMNAMGLTTPKGLPWSKIAVANYIRTNALPLNPTNEKE